MKTEGMKHQIEALRRMAQRDAFALFMEQGTGKTWVFMADAELAYRSGAIDGLLVLAPKGVHTNWVLREAPTHISVPYIAEAWRASMGKRRRAQVDRLLRPRDPDEVPPLRLLAMNYDALMTKDGFDFARSFLRATRACIVLDESHRIKSPSAARTKRVMALRPMAKRVRIGTGTPITNSPLDVFAQMEFLESGLLGTTSARAFVAEFADVLPPDHPMIARLARTQPNVTRAQIIARNPDGSPRYRNLDKLQSLLAPHSFRVLKRDCLDLPPKVYQQRFFELSPRLQAAYDELENDLRVTLEDDSITTVAELAALTKLQQITSGFINIEASAHLLETDANPRTAALLDAVEDLEGQFIVWAKFREELRQVAAALRAAGITAVEYHGGVNAADREAAVDAFQEGRVRAFVAQPKAGGTGLTLTAARAAIYYSNDFNLGDRVQSEDRCHRIGTTESVLYIDIVAQDTIDVPIARALQRKTAIAAAILGDRGLKLRNVSPATT